jgi:hypothetical protein
MLHHGNSVVTFGVANDFWVGQSSNCSFGIFESSFSDKPPWRRRTEVDDSKERRDPNPLNDKGDSPGPVACDRETSFDDTG